MAERYVHLVGILGEPNAGKTGCLVSLYLSVMQTTAWVRVFLCGQPHVDGLRGNQPGCPPLERRPDSGPVYRPHGTAGQPHRWIPAPQARPHAAGELGRSALFRLAGRVDHGSHRPKPQSIGFSSSTERMSSGWSWTVRETVAPDKRQVCLQRTKMAIGRLGNFLASGTTPRLGHYPPG